MSIAMPAQQVVECRYTSELEELSGGRLHKMLVGSDERGEMEVRKWTSIAWEKVGHF